MSPEGESIRDAVLLLIDSAGNDGGELALALRRAFTEAQQHLGDALEGRHLPDVEERHAELDAYLSDGAGAPPLAYATWLLVLSHLTPDEQRRLQREYEELARAVDAAAEFGEKRAGDGEGLMHALSPVEPLLADLPHTTLDRSPGVDDYELRRRSLSIEVTTQPDTDGASHTEPLHVAWRDGYQTLVARMSAGCHEQHLVWRLEVEDPAPGKSATRVVSMATDDVHQAARDDLEEAVAWAASELGDNYIIAPLQPNGA